MMDVLTLHRRLLASGARHEIVRLPRAISNGSELAEVLGLPRRRCVVVRFCLGRFPDRFGEDLIAVILPAGPPPTLAEVAEAVGAVRLRPAAPHRVNAATDYAAALAAPLMLPPSLPAFIDRRIADLAGPYDVVYTPTGESGTALGIRLRDLLALCSATPIELTPAEPRAGRTSGRPARTVPAPAGEATAAPRGLAG